MKRFAIIAVLCALSLPASNPAFADSEETVDEEGNIVVTVHKPKRKRDREWCRSCGVVTVTFSTPPGATDTSINIKSDNLGSREDRRLMQQCQDILEAINEASYDLGFIKNYPIEILQMEEQEALGKQRDAMNSHTIARDQAMEQWAEAGCNDLLGSGPAVIAADTGYTAGSAF